MKHKFILVFLCSFFCLSCTNPKAFGEDSLSIRINRFDVDLYQFLQNKTADEEFLQKDSLFLNVFGERVVFIGTTDSVGFFERLRYFFSEPTLRSLYGKQQEVFADVTPFEKELSTSFSLLLKEFSQLTLPQIYMHVSGLNQNIIVTDSILSLSADKYLGSDFPLYQEFFYDYQRQRMRPEQVVPDYLLGFLYSELPFEGNENALLDRMLYEGKIHYILSQILTERDAWETFGYTKEQYEWCVKSEDRIWKTILQQKQLYTTDYMITSQFINDAPYTAPLTDSSPGRVGVWVGYRIVSSFMKNHPKITFSELIEMTNYQDFLKEARYKP
ncbi:MAG: gliding motility protein GldB [Dysgonamonadaceae bacterium]|nr:gliding motility protein GldB [Dysgonamonadaceae bacterium]